MARKTERPLLRALLSGVILTLIISCDDASAPHPVEVNHHAPVTSDSVTSDPSTSAPVTSAQTRALTYQHEQGFCDDTDAQGAPYSPARPLWSDLEGAHYDGITHPNGSASQRIPDYKNISHNTTILQSLQLLLSVITDATSAIEDAQSFLEEGDYVDAAIGAVIPQVDGHCVCLTGGCDPVSVLDDVEQMLNQLLALDIYGALERFVQEKIDSALADVDLLLAILQDAASAQGAFASRLNMGLTNTTTSAITGVSLNACSGILSSPDLTNAITSHLNTLVTQIVSDYQTVQDALTGWKSFIQMVRADWVFLKDTFEDVEGLSDLAGVDWGAVSQRLETSGAVYERRFQDVMDAVEVGTIWYTNILAFDAHIDRLAQDAYSAIITSLQGSSDPQTSLCGLALEDPASYAGGQPSVDDFIDGFTQALRVELEREWSLIRTEIDALRQTFSLRVTGGGVQLSMRDVFREFSGFDRLITTTIEECYIRDKRPACYDFCSATSGADFIWLPVDFLQDSSAAVAGVASAALFMLEQTEWLDEVKAWVRDNLEGELFAQLGDALDFVSDLAQEVAETVNAVLEVLGAQLEYIDLFTEGYHFGAYDALRPDLHQCVAWAGHGAYARYGSGSGKVSVGARYGAFQLSEERRVQLRTGGFAASAYGATLSIAPNLALNAQIDGWKLWDQSAPLGIQLPPNLSVNSNVLARYDAFNVAPSDTFGSGNMNWGGYIVRDLYPSRPTALSVYDWPRPAVNQPWEGVSTAAATLGLNLGFDFPKHAPAVITLAEIDIIPRLLIAIPFLTFQTGVQWLHETNLQRQRVQDMVNMNLPVTARLEESDFNRDMHAMQAPDLTDDNRVSAYVTPGLGIAAFLGFKAWKIRFGIMAGLRLEVRVEPSATGGIADLNVALIDTLLHSNPPADAECEPIWNVQSPEGCSNVDFVESTGAYSCDDPSPGASCCIQLNVTEPDGTTQSYGACIDEWLGITQSTCTTIGNADDTIAAISEALDGLSFSVGDATVALQHGLATAEAADITATWRANASCADQPCSWSIDAVNEVFSSGVISVGVPSECDQHGYCVVDGVTTHDITQEDCEDPEEAGLRRWYAYQCTKRTSATLLGWEGPGCHPLQGGFPSACGCLTDDDCSTGETCVGANPPAQFGQCTDGAPSFSCICNAAGACPSGRTCVDGACAKSCSVDADCARDRVCQSNACVPPHDVPTAESVVWGMDNTTAPAHAITTYAYSDIEATFTLAFDLVFDASFKLFGRSKVWKLIDYHTATDLGSTRKGWYQPGLEAIYQDECSDPALSTPVTNRHPRSTTTGVDVATIAGVSAKSLCLNGGVCRYPDALPASEASPDAYTLGNAGDVSDLIEWCRDTVPSYMENPDPSTNDGIVNAIVDASTFAKDVAVGAYINNPICVNGEPWDDWMTSVAPTYDELGNLVSPGSLGALDCRYDDPRTGTTWTFPCSEINQWMLTIWGCLDVNASVWAAQLVAEDGFGITTTLPGYGSPPTTVFDLDEMFVSQAGVDPIFGPGATTDLSLSSMVPRLLTYSTPFGSGSLAENWLRDVRVCFDSRYNDVAETACECTSTSDCTGDQRCSNGVCEDPQVYNATGACLNPDCSPNWVAATCTIVSLQAQIGPCCGDGVTQANEECDDGTSGSATCTPDCTLINRGGVGACCLGEGQCVEPLTDEECVNRGGVYHGAQSCLDMNYCGDSAPPPPTPRGACCTGRACLDDLTAIECSAVGGALSVGELCSALPECVVRGACCTGDAGCFDDVPAHLCPPDAVFSSADTCATLQCGDEPQELGACCEADGGCTEDVASETCRARRGVWSGGSTCDSGICGDEPPELGACCEADGGCTDRVTSEICRARRGVWSVNATCDSGICGDPQPLGSCCVVDSGRGRCNDGVTSATCARDGGTWTNGGSCANLLCGDAPTGACCEADGSCADSVLERACGGAWFPGNTCAAGVCAPPGRLGSCCEVNGTCNEDVTKSWCSSRGGGWAFGGVCADCGAPPTGVCCNVDGECVDQVTINECPTSAWIPFLTCADPNVDAYCDAEAESESVGACCISNRCEALSSSQCRLMGGLWSESVTCEEAGCGGFGGFDPNGGDDPETPDWCAASPLIDTPCSSCDVYACDERGVLTCNELPNACGGCAPLDESPGSECGACGIWSCLDADTLDCVEPEEGCPDNETPGGEESGGEESGGEESGGEESGGGEIMSGAEAGSAEAGSDEAGGGEIMSGAEAGSAEAGSSTSGVSGAEAGAERAGSSAPETSGETADSSGTNSGASDERKRSDDSGCDATSYAPRVGLWMIIIAGMLRRRAHPRDSGCR